MKKDLLDGTEADVYFIKTEVVQAVWREKSKCYKKNITSKNCNMFNSNFTKYDKEWENIRRLTSFYFYQKK